MRIGKIPVKYEDFYLTEISKACPDVRIEEYQTRFDKKNYDALITVRTDIDRFPVCASEIDNFIKKNEIIDYFEFLGEISDRAFHQITVDDTRYARNPIRHLRNVNNAYFPGKIIPMEVKQGTLYIHGIFGDKKAFNKCVSILKEEEGIEIQEDECYSWAIDHENVFDFFPTIFDAMGIDSQITGVLIKALAGDTDSAHYLEGDTNFLDAILRSHMLEDEKFLGILKLIELEILRGLLF